MLEVPQRLFRVLLWVWVVRKAWKFKLTTLTSRGSYLFVNGAVMTMLIAWECLLGHPVHWCNSVCRSRQETGMPVAPSTSPSHVALLVNRRCRKLVSSAVCVLLCLAQWWKCSNYSSDEGIATSLLSLIPEIRFHVH